VIPLRDVIPSRTFPAVNIALIVLNTIVFFYELSMLSTSLLPLMGVFAFVLGIFAWPTIFI